MCSLGPLTGPQLLCADSKEIRPRRICLNDAGLLLVFFFLLSFLITVGFSAPANQHWFFPVKQTFHFSGAEFLLITADSSGLADQKHRFLIQNIPQIALLMSLRDSEASQAGSPLSVLLSMLTSKFPQQLSKLWVPNGFSSAKLSSPRFLQIEGSKS